MDEKETVVDIYVLRWFIEIFSNVITSPIPGLSPEVNEKLIVFLEGVLKQNNIKPVKLYQYLNDNFNVIKNSYRLGAFIPIKDLLLEAKKRYPELTVTVDISLDLDYPNMKIFKTKEDKNNVK